MCAREYVHVCVRGWGYMLETLSLVQKEGTPSTLPSTLPLPPAGPPEPRNGACGGRLGHTWPLSGQT